MDELLEMVILDGVEDDDLEFVVLDNLLINRDDLPQRPIFDLNNYSDQEIKENFRFERDDLPLLLRASGIPEEVVAPTGNKVTGMTALCMILKRMAYPSRLSDLKQFFGYSPQSLSHIINTTIAIIDNHTGHLLDNLNNLLWLTPQRMRNYAQSIHNKGGVIDNCWAFIDGTCRAMCRPSLDQEEYYSGHKKFHCLKYQSVLCPDGILASLKGAYPGRRHDAAIFRDSRLYQELEQKAVFNEERFVLYGDQGYAIMELLITPYPGQPENLAPHQMAFNQSMKTLRVAVEWGFAKVIQQFAFVDFKKNQKLMVQDLESMYRVATLFTNFHTCLYGSQTADYFNVVPPTLQEYCGLQ